MVGSFNAAASVRNEVTDSSIVQFMHELNRIRVEDVSEKQLQSIKNYITGGFARSLESPQTIANFAINTDRYGLPKDYYPNYLKNIQAVTVADVKEMATKYIMPENAHILVVGKASEVAEKLARFGEVQNYDIEGEPYTPSTAADLPADLTAQKVIDQYIAALGGKEALMKIVDFTTVSTASMMGQEMKVTSISKVPNKVYMDINAGGMEVMKQVFDGNNMKAYQMGQAMPIPEKEAKEAAITSYLFGELKYDELGVSAALTGLEKVEGKDCYVVEITLPTGSKATQYFDKASGLKIKESKTVETPQGEFSQSFVFDEYKPVSGVMFPHKMAMSSGPQNINMEVTSLEVNTGVADDQFIVD
ncbi:MAG: insulinase family protein [Cyclobacteriaceae bacterium]